MSILFPSCFELHHHFAVTCCFSHHQTCSWGDIKSAILCSTADERPSVKSISETLSIFPVYFILVGVGLVTLFSFLSVVLHTEAGNSNVCGGRSSFAHHHPRVPWETAVAPSDTCGSVGMAANIVAREGLTCDFHRLFHKKLISNFCCLF